MKRQIENQKTARELRSNGKSIIEIGKIIGCSKSSVSVWVRDVILTENQKDQLSRRTYEKKSICKGCGTEFIKNRIKRKNIYCSLECYAINGIKRRQRKLLDSKVKCLFCGTEQNGFGGKFCSAKCCIEYQWKIKVDIANKTGFAPSNQASAKRLILKMRGHKCEICNNTTWIDSPIPLVLDHINGHSNDWRIENLRLVCGNCDMKLPTYKSKNKGNGRKYDREYRNKINKGSVAESGLMRPI